MHSNGKQIIWIILVYTVSSTWTSSCLPEVPGICGCCNSKKICTEIPYNVLSFVTPNYICISKEEAKNFAFSICDCTLKDPPLCLCFNHTKSFPIYGQCDSFAECTIADIQVQAKHQIHHSLCKRPIRTGRCSYNFTTRFYFDSDHNICKEFMYSGCSANRNAFLTREFCEHTCQF